MTLKMRPKVESSSNSHSSTFEQSESNAATQPAKASISEDLNKLSNSVDSSDGSPHSLPEKADVPASDSMKRSIDSISDKIPRSEPNLHMISSLKQSPAASQQNLQLSEKGKPAQRSVGFLRDVDGSNGRLSGSEVAKLKAGSSSSVSGSFQLNISKLSVASDESDDYVSPVSFRSSSAAPHRKASMLVTTLPADDLIDNFYFRPSRAISERRRSTKSPLAATFSQKDEESDEDDDDNEENSKKDSGAIKVPDAGEEPNDFQNEHPNPVVSLNKLPTASEDNALANSAAAVRHFPLDSNPASVVNSVTHSRDAFSSASLAGSQRQSMSDFPSVSQDQNVGAAVSDIDDSKASVRNSSQAFEKELQSARRLYSDGATEKNVEKSMQSMAESVSLNQKSLSSTLPGHNSQTLFKADSSKRSSKANASALNQNDGETFASSTMTQNQTGSQASSKLHSRQASNQSTSRNSVVKEAPVSKTPIQQKSLRSSLASKDTSRSNSNDSLHSSGGRVKSVPNLSSAHHSKTVSRHHSKDNLLALALENAAKIPVSERATSLSKSTSRDSLGSSSKPVSKASNSPRASSKEALNIHPQPNKSNLQRELSTSNSMSSRSSSLNSLSLGNRIKSVPSLASKQSSSSSTRQGSVDLKPKEDLSRSSSVASLGSLSSQQPKSLAGAGAGAVSGLSSSKGSRQTSITAKPPDVQRSGTTSPVVRASQVGTPVSIQSRSSSMGSLKLSRKIKSVPSLSSSSKPQSNVASRSESKQNLLLQALATAAALIEKSATGVTTTKKSEDSLVVSTETGDEPHQLTKTISQYINPTTTSVENFIPSEDPQNSAGSSVDMALLMQSVLSLDESANATKHDQDSEFVKDEFEHIVSIDDSGPNSGTNGRSKEDIAQEAAFSNTATIRESAKQVAILEPGLNGNDEEEDVFHDAIPNEVTPLVADSSTGKDNRRTSESGELATLTMPRESIADIQNQKEKKSALSILDAVMQDMARPMKTDSHPAIESSQPTQNPKTEEQEFSPSDQQAIDEESTDMKHFFKSMLGLHSAKQSKTSVERDHLESKASMGFVSQNSSNDGLLQSDKESKGVRIETNIEADLQKNLDDFQDQHADKADLNEPSSEPQNVQAGDITTGVEGAKSVKVNQTPIENSGEPLFDKEHTLLTNEIISDQNEPLEVTKSMDLASEKRKESLLKASDGSIDMKRCLESLMDLEPSQPNVLDEQPPLKTQNDSQRASVSKPLPLQRQEILEPVEPKGKPASISNSLRSSRTLASSKIQSKHSLNRLEQPVDVAIEEVTAAIPPIADNMEADSLAETKPKVDDIFAAVMQDMNSAHSKSEPPAAPITDSTVNENQESSSKDIAESVSDMKNIFQSVLGLHSATQSKTEVAKENIQKPDAITKAGNPLEMNDCDGFQSGLQDEHPNQEFQDAAATSPQTNTPQIKSSEEIFSLANEPIVATVLGKSQSQPKLSTTKDDSFTKSEPKESAEAPQRSNSITITHAADTVIPGWNPDFLANMEYPSGHSSNATSFDSPSSDRKLSINESSPKQMKRTTSKPSSMKGSKVGKNAQGSFSYASGQEGLSSTRSLKAGFDPKPPQIREFEPDISRESTTTRKTTESNAGKGSIWDEILTYDRKERIGCGVVQVGGAPQQQLSNWLKSSNTKHSYLQVSNIAAAALRRSLKPEARVAALKREEQFIKFAKWTGGKQGEIKLLYKDQA
ncbi:hypothetical protein BDR26DRAFT_1011938 [Obelidium mucronatum]|nr:hypothetical protein BDR26DRAFT_1011938 [Obelidium mucronatum]